MNRFKDKGMIILIIIYDVVFLNNVVDKIISIKDGIVENV